MTTIPAETREQTDAAAPRERRKRSRRRAWLITLGVLVVLVVAGRLALEPVVRWYVIRTLDRSEVYHGLIGAVRLHLWRGGYSIEDVRLVKTTGNVPVPFFAADRIDLAIEWSSLLSGRLVGKVVMERPRMAFVHGRNQAESQTGSGGPWLELIRDLFPFQINSADIHDGRIHFRSFHTKPQVDVWLNQVEGSILDLTNIHDDVTPLVARVHATALAMDHAKVEYEMRLDPFSYRPTFHIALRLIGLDVKKTNALARAYGAFDFERGWLDLVLELDAKEGFVVEGYVKPLFRNLKVFDLAKDARQDDVLTLFWEAVVGVASGVLRNQKRDQIATVIPVRGELDRPGKDLLATIGNLLRNAFVRAYLPRFQGKEVSEPTITFGQGSVVEPGAPGDK